MSIIVLLTVSAVLLMLLIATLYFISVQKISKEEAKLLYGLQREMLERNPLGYSHFSNYIWSVDYKK